MIETTHTRETGWNTWDTFQLTGYVRLPERVGLRILFFDPMLRTGPTTETLIEPARWEEVERIGPHSGDGRYAEIRLKVREQPFVVRLVSDGDVALAHVHAPERTALRGAAVLYTFGKSERDDAQDRPGGYRLELVAGRATADLLPTSVRVLPLLKQKPGFSEKTRFLAFALDEPVCVVCLPTGKEPPALADALESITKARQACTSAGLHGGGLLSGLPEAMMRIIRWNTIFAPQTGRICTPVSRNWAADYGGHVLFDWDTYFCAILSSIEDPPLAAMNARAITAEVTPRGFIPNVASPRGRSDDRSQPPVGAWAVLKVALTTGDLSLVEELYPTLLGWNRWWMAARDGNGDGLLSWGADPQFTADRDADWLRGWAGPHEGKVNRQLAMWESGLDNSPTFDSARYVPEAHTLDQDDVGLNSLYALDCEMLALMATMLGRDDEAAVLSAERERLAARMQETLWNEEAGTFMDWRWRGEFTGRLAPTCFYPLLAGLATVEQARRMVHEHLLDEYEFWGQYVIPSIARNDPAFTHMRYWRGPVWGPMNYLVYEGLKRYHFDDVAAEFAAKSAALFRGEWQSHGWVCENYDALTGQRTSVQSDPLYHWGALLAFIAVQELIDVSPLTGLRFGTTAEAADARVTNVQIAGHLYSVVRRANGLTVEWDGNRRETRFFPQSLVSVSSGELLWTLPPRTEWSGVEWLAETITLVSRSANGGPVRLGLETKGVSSNGQPTKLHTSDGLATFVLPAGRCTLTIYRVSR